MPKFIIEREVPGAGNLSDAQLREISQKSVSVLREMGPGIQWLHSYITGDKVYCVYVAPDEETIREAISGQICRCTGYTTIVRSIQWAAQHATSEVAQS